MQLVDFKTHYSNGVKWVNPFLVTYINAAYDNTCTNIHQGKSFIEVAEKVDVVAARLNAAMRGERVGQYPL